MIAQEIEHRLRPWQGPARVLLAAERFAQRLFREFGVATIPLSAFDQDGTDHRVIRFCFAKREQTLLAAAERLQRLRA